MLSLYGFGWHIWTGSQLFRHVSVVFKWSPYRGKACSSTRATPATSQCQRSTPPISTFSTVLNSRNVSHPGHRLRSTVHYVWKTDFVQTSHSHCEPISLGLISLTICQLLTPLCTHCWYNSHLFQLKKPFICMLNALYCIMCESFCQDQLFSLQTWHRIRIVHQAADLFGHNFSLSYICTKCNKLIFKKMFSSMYISLSILKLCS